MSKKDEKGNPVFVAVVLDETSSMGCIYDETISAFNEYVKTLQDSGEPFLFGQVNFNSNYINTVHGGIPIADVPLLDKESYRPQGCTPLYDAVAQTIYGAEEKERELHEAGTPHDVLIMIQTDGEENASQEFNVEQVKALIATKQEAGWAFVFIGADQDAWAGAGSMGIGRGQTMAHHGDQIGAAMMSNAAATMNYASSSPMRRASLRNDFYDTGGAGVDTRDDSVAPSTTVDFAKKSGDVTSGPRKTGVRF